jgi:flavin reductase (DIM6/NTAB) family NADH-FMN oxidoreductase RutF
MANEGDHSAFDELVCLLNYPMFIVTTRAGDELAGCLVGFTSRGGSTSS